MNMNSLIEDALASSQTTGSLNRKERDKLLRRWDILRAAERVFALKGFHKATMQDIAQEAQYATGTAYLYFKDKDMLYFSILENKIKELLLILKSKVDKGSCALERLKIFVRENLVFFERNQDFFSIFFSERTNIQAVKDAKLSKSSVVAQYKGYVIELIKTCQGEKVIRLDFSAQKLADVFNSIFTTAIFGWLAEGKKGTLDLEAMSEFILDIFLSGAGKKK